MQALYCEDKEHQDNPLNLFCLEVDCQNKGLICSFCLLKSHQAHVKNVFPLKTIVQSLNKANNPKNQQELHNKGNEIFGKHHNIKQTFRQNLIEIKEILNKLEKEIEKQIKLLDLEADLFVGDAFEKSISMLNMEKLTKGQIEQAIEKIEPLLKTCDGQLWILRDTEVNQQAQKLIKTAEVIERESKYWLEKCLTDLKNCMKPVKIRQKQVKILSSQNRYQLTYEQWNLKETDAICLRSKRNMIFGFLVLGCMRLHLGQKRSWYFKCKYLKDQMLIAKIIYQDNFVIKNDMEFVNHIGKIYFTKAIKIEYDKPYTIALTPNESCLSYYGANGKFETDEFLFQEPTFSQEFSDNSTTINQGVVPQFFYEE